MTTTITKQELEFLDKDRNERAAELVIANKELVFQNEEKEKRAAELIIANRELVFQNKEKENRAAELIIANRELVIQNEEKEKKARELIIANGELAFQNAEKEKRAAELIIANTELAYQNKEKEKKAKALIIANGELAFQNAEKEKRAAELIIANAELAYQNKEKEKKAKELIVANGELAFQNAEKEKRAAELIIANTELAYQNKEKENRSAELAIANKELAFQNVEKEKRAAELILSNKELVIQNREKENRAAELIIANTELAFQNNEKEKRAVELSVANHELKKAEEQFRLVVECSPTAVVVISKDGTMQLVNAETEKLFGYDRHEIVGRKIEMLIPDRFRFAHKGHRQDFFLLPETRSMGAGPDLFAVGKTGLEIPVEIRLNPIETTKGQMVLASIVDITERKNQEQNLRKENKELEQFAYVASHDLQEPLRTVSNYMEAFEEDYSHLLDARALLYLQSVNKATRRMSGLIKSLLDFSRLGHDKILESADVNKLISEVCADLATMIEKSGAIIHVANMPTLKLYESEVRQIFQNLISNAIKFKKKDIIPEITISAEQTNDFFLFSVRDNGIGISPKSFYRVFEIFQRLHTSEKYEGSGIGLANCKKIAQMHNGDIWVESEIDKGSTFYFTISTLII